MKRSLIASALVVSLLAVGCTENADPAITGNTGGINTPNNVNPGTVVGQPGTNPASGVDLQNVGPEVVVDQFLRALQQGNREMVASLLTVMARTETAKYGLEVQPESIPNSTFKIVQAAYVPEEDPMATPTVAHVASLWAEDGGEEAYEIIWVLRHEQAGWRISAMGMTIDFNKDPLVLDFEHPEEMMRVREQAMQDLATEAAMPAGQPADGTSPAVDPAGQPATFNAQDGVTSQPVFPNPGFQQNPVNQPPTTSNGFDNNAPLRQPAATQANAPGGVANPIRR